MDPGGLLAGSRLPVSQPCQHGLGRPFAVPRPHLLRHRPVVCNAAQRQSRRRHVCNPPRQIAPYKFRGKKRKSCHRSWRTLAAPQPESVIDTGQTPSEVDEELDAFIDSELDAIAEEGGMDKRVYSKSRSDQHKQPEPEVEELINWEPPEEEEEEDPNIHYPERPTRCYTLESLFDKANIELPEDFDEEQRQVLITGLQNDYDMVKPGDLYINVPCLDEGYLDLIERKEPDNIRAPEYCDATGFLVARAIQQGATAVMAGTMFESDLDIEVPVVVVPDCEDAQQRLAVAFYDHPSAQMEMVGVTGRVGKTCVSWLIRAMFDELENSPGLISTVELGMDLHRLDEEGDLWRRPERDWTRKRDCSAPYCLAPYRGKYPIPESLPDGLHIHKVLAGQAERGAKASVLECSAEDIKERSVSMVDFDVIVFTNTQPDFITVNDDGKAVGEFWQFEDEAAMVEAHGAIFQMLTNPDKQRAVVNLDDPAAKDIMKYASAVPSVTYAINNPVADVFAQKVTMTIWQSDLIIRTPLGLMEIETTLIGRNNVYNVLAAVAAGLALNVPLKAIKAGIEAAEKAPVPGVTEFIDLKQNFQVIVDSADTPERLIRLLDDIRECEPKKILLVVGCEGEITDKDFRSEMGKVAHYKAELVFFTNQNQRHEPPKSIIDDILQGLPDEIRDWNNELINEGWEGGFLQDPIRVTENCLMPDYWEQSNWYRRHVIEDRWTAIRYAIAMAQQGDVVVVAGKGHRDWTEVGDGAGGTGTVIGWLDDRVECRHALSTVTKFARYPELDRSELPWMRVSKRGSAQGNDKNSRQKERYEAKEGRETRFWELGEMDPVV